MNEDNTELKMARAYALYTNRNIFLTGKAGTGKTTFLRNLWAESRKRTIIVAPTGVAAINASGVTIHSFFQLKPGLFLPGGRMVAGRDARNRFSFSKQKQNILRTLDLLVIDEISMVRADLLDAIDDVLRRYQKRDMPFGGVQLLLIGDLQQLAPVATEDEWQVLKEFYATPYFFSSTALAQTDFVCIELQHVYRQADEKFVNILNAVRDGHVDAPTLARLNTRYMPGFRPPVEENWITLTTHNAQAAAINNRRLQELTTAPSVFEAKVNGEFPELSYPTDASLTLKPGAQVMFCKNDASTAKLYYNGLIGRIIDIAGDKVTVLCDSGRIEVKPQTWENTKYNIDTSTGVIKEEIVGTFTQIPLRTAWAITIHKSQGLTFDHAIVNAGRAFSYGQVYVALSRCRTLEGLVLATPITPDIITTDPDVVQFRSYAAAHQPSAETFIRDRRSFIEDILCDIFDFKALSMRMRYIERLAMEYAGQYFPAYARAAHETATQLDAQLMAVGLRFQQQIHDLVPLAASYSQNTALRQRVQAAMTYYCKQTSEILGSFLNLEQPEIDNKQHNEQLTRELEQLHTDYDLKMRIYIACQTEFSLDAYWDAKAMSNIDDSPAAKRKPRASRRSSSKNAVHVERFASAERPTTASTTPGNVNQSIYRALLDWRKAVAAERKMPPSYVMPLRTIVALASQMPQTPEDLIAISGIGKKTAADHGPDLLEIVRKNM